MKSFKYLKVQNVYDWSVGYLNWRAKAVRAPELTEGPVAIMSNSACLERGKHGASTVTCDCTVKHKFQTLYMSTFIPINRYFNRAAV